MPAVPELPPSVVFQQIPPSVLFPVSRPAGWGQEEFDPFAQERSRKAAERARVDAVAKLRELSADIFEECCEAGLTALEAIDALIEEPEYTKARAEFHRRSEGAPPLPYLTARERFPARLFAANLGLGRTLDTGGKQEKTIQMLLRRLRKFPDAGKVISSVAPEVRRSNPLWFLQDRLLPPPIMRGMLASHRAAASLQALDGLIVRRQWVAGLIIGVAGIWGSESRRYLAMLASIPEANVSSNVVPEVERIDFAAAIAGQRSLIAKLSDTES